MGRIRGLAAVAATLSLTTAFIGGPASAQSTAEAYVGSATGTALDVKVFGTGATVGFSKASANSTPQAVGDGSGVVGVAATVAHSEVSGSGTDTKPDACAVPLDLPLVTVKAACGSSSASITGGNPTASGKGTVGNIVLDASSLTSALTPTLTTLVTTVCGVTTIASNVTSLAQQVPLLLGNQLPVLPAIASVLDPTQCSNLLNGLLSALTQGKLLDVSIGDSTATVTADASNVSSVGTAEAASIKIGVLPATPIPGLVSTEPLVTITAGSAKATATYARSSGQTSSSFDPSLVKVRLNLLVAPPTEVSVPVGQSQVVLAGTPLESEIIVGAGSSKTNPDGTITAVADGVKVHLLRNVNGGVLLNLAHAEAGVGGTPPAAGPVAAPAAELPRTGGTPWIPLAGVSILGLAVLVRRLLVRAY